MKSLKVELGRNVHIQPQDVQAGSRATLLMTNNSTSEYTSKRNECIYPQKDDLHENVLNSFIHNRQKLETIQKSANR